MATVPAMPDLGSDALDSAARVGGPDAELYATAARATREVTAFSRARAG